MEPVEIDAAKTATKAMKSIHFDNMKKRGWIAVLILSGILILAGGFEVIPFEDPAVNKFINGLGFLLQMIYFSRMFWYKNFVQWNKKGAYIRINSFSGRSLSFDQVKAIELKETQLIITKTNGSRLSFSLKKIKRSEAKKLNEILLKNSVATRYVELWQKTVSNP